MTGFFRKVRMIFAEPDEKNLWTVPKFAQAHKNFLIIVADPATDRIFVGHKGRFVNGRIRSVKGRPTHTVRDMMKKSHFKQSAIDAFIVSLADTLKISLPDGNQFYSFVDGAIFNIAKAIRDEKKGKRADRPPASSGIPSPIEAVEGQARGEL